MLDLVISYSKYLWKRIREYFRHQKNLIYF
jgi:hypothetical protein